ncbi:MAG: acyl-CoA/acyl-ACP dehydrogenase [Proteobacteria bacterium]|nr:acyl-CoA/acyl-ACP dehydrogenase [Pseudomonadota bacterium]
MNFDLSEEQRLLQDGVDRLLREELPAPRLREAFDGDAAFDATLWNRLCEQGACGLHLPEALGGAGLELLELALVAERLGYAAAPVPFWGHALAGLAIDLGGSEAQKRRWLPRLAAGDVLTSVAWAETDSRWQPEQWSLPPGPSLSGVKEFVPAGREADLLLVGLAGGELALVETADGGVAAEPVEAIDRTRRLDRVRFEAARADPLPAGAAVSSRVRDAGLVLLAADAFGGASRCLELAVDYAQTREQFGVTIAHFQAVKHQLANLAVEVEPARSLFWYAAHVFDRRPAEAPASAALAKAHLCDVFVHAARETVEVHGGFGYTWECDVQFWLKRAVFDRAVLGDPDLHRARTAELLDWGSG